MRELGKIVNNEVIINDGKVYANALTAGSVISAKVSAGAIQTGAIAANSTLYLLAIFLNSISSFSSFSTLTHLK